MELNFSFYNFLCFSYISIRVSKTIGENHMKFLALIPALCLVCFGCNNASSPNRSSSQESSSDWAITTKVKAAILSDSSVSGSARFVSVTTNNGVVTLTGNVPSQADAGRIVKITKNVEGVRSVDNQMNVPD